MENIKQQSIDLFNKQFKFSINQELRHKGDSKGSFQSDMGLLVLERHLIEECDDDGNVQFTRNYVCRMIRFSGSGDIARFKESELMSIYDFNKKVVQEEQEREDMRNEAYAVKQEVFKSFGVNRGTEVYLKNGDVVDTASIYKVTGFSRSNDETLLILRKEAGEGRTADEVRVKSKGDFQLFGVISEKDL